MKVRIRNQIIIRKLLGLLCFIIAGLLLFNLIISLLTDSNLAAYFYTKGSFSKVEFLLKNKYILENKLCKSGECKKNKVKPALQDLVNFYYSQRDYDSIITLYEKHIGNSEINLLPTRIKSQDNERLKFIAYTELAYFYLMNEQYNETKKTLNKVFDLIQKHPDFKELEFIPYSILTNYYANIGRLDDAIRVASKTVFIYKNVEQKYVKYINLAKIYYKKGMLKRAEYYIQLAYSNLPDFLYLTPLNALLETNNIYGKILEKDGNLDAAKARFHSSKSLSGYINSRYDFENICSIYFLTQVNKKLKNENFQQEYRELSELTKSLTTLKNLNQKEQYEKLETLCSFSEYGL